MKVDAKNLRQKITRSKEIRKKFLDDKDFFLNLYVNEANSDRDRKRKDTMQVNYVYSHIRLVSPTIFAGKPRINVKSAQTDNPMADFNAENLEGVIHYWAKELGASDEFNSALFDSYFGLAAVEVGWDYRTVVSEELLPLTDEAGEYILGQDGMPVMKMQQVEKVKKDKPFVRWRDSRDIILDVDVPRRKDGRFIVIRDVVSHDDFMKMEEIPMKIREKVKPTVRPEDKAGDDYKDSRDRAVSSDLEWVELEWFWCRESEKRYLLTPALPNEILLTTDWPYTVNYENDPFPITIMDSVTDQRYPYSFSEFRPAMEHIRELNRLRTNTAYHVKASQPKFIYNKQSMTRSQASKLANARPDEMVEVNNLDGIRQAPNAVFPSETFQWNGQIESDLIKLTGLVEYEGAPSGGTATEASIIEGRSQVRKRARSGQFERFVVSTLVKLGQLCQQYQSEATIVEILGPKGKSWRRVSKEDIQGDFAFDYEPGIMEFKNEALRKQQLLRFAEIMGPNAHVDQRALATELTKAFDLSPEKLLRPEQEMQQPAPEPTIKFKPIDMMLIPDPQVQAAIVHAALQQNSVSTGAPQGGPEQEVGGPPAGVLGTNMPSPESEMVGVPQGGKVPLAPVDGLAATQPMSEMQ